MTNPATPETGFVMSGPLYERLKFFTMIVLPALATLYLTLGYIWGFPAIEQTVGSMTAISTFLGVVLRISSKTYQQSDRRFAGTLNISETEHGTILHDLAYDGPLENIEGQKEITFRVHSTLPPSE